MSTDVFPPRPIPRHASRGFVFPAPAWDTKLLLAGRGFACLGGSYCQPGNQTMSLKRSSEIGIQVSTGQNQMNSATAPPTIAHATGR